MSKTVRFGIALYSPLKEGEGRHWALVLGRPGDNTFVGKVNVYQIVHKDGGSGYKLFHKIVDDGSGADLTKSSRYYGIVYLGSPKVVTDNIFGSVEEQPAEQDGYTLPTGKVWSCAWWVIRALRTLQNKEGVVFNNLPAKDLDLYDRVVGPLADAMSNLTGLREVNM